MGLKCASTPWKRLETRASEGSPSQKRTMRDQRVIKGLGELGLRVADLEQMVAFYEQIVGL
jgi:hypothetical protein